MRTPHNLVLFRTSDGTTTYAYDPAGNRTSNGFTAGTNDTISTDGVYIYDAKGN